MLKKWNWAPYLLVAPAVLLMICVVVYPILNSMNMSLFNYVLTKPNETAFVGIGNYINAFKDTLFLQSLWKTIIWVTFGVGMQFLFGLILALILNQNFKLRGLIRSVILIPWVTPGVLIALMWTWMYDGNYGVLNDILYKLGITKEFVPFLSLSSTAMWSVIVTIVWQGIPFFAIMLLAGLQAIPNELYEASDVDGASRLQKFFYVTIPSIKNTIFVTLMLRIIWVANSIDVIYSMTGGGPAYATQTLSVYTYIKANKALDFGYASTLSIILTLVLSVISVAYLKNLFKSQKG